MSALPKLNEHMGHKRALRRRRALKSARLYPDTKGALPVECRIVDITSRGARLRFSKPVQLGERVSLTIMPEMVTVNASVRWVNGAEAGFSFDKPVEWLARHDATEA